MGLHCKELLREPRLLIAAGHWRIILVSERMPCVRYRSMQAGDYVGANAAAGLSHHPLSQPGLKIVTALGTSSAQTFTGSLLGTDSTHLTPLVSHDLLSTPLAGRAGEGQQQTEGWANTRRVHIWLQHISQAPPFSPPVHG
jgi:hypothetical protein